MGSATFHPPRFPGPFLDAHPGLCTSSLFLRKKLPRANYMRFRPYKAGTDLGWSQKTIIPQGRMGAQEREDPCCCPQMKRKVSREAERKPARQDAAGDSKSPSDGRWVTGLDPAQRDQSVCSV